MTNSDFRYNDTIPLGRSGIVTTRLGMGTGSAGWNGESRQTKLGTAAFVRLVRHAFDSGVTFFDCADAYGSHPFMRAALAEIPREQVQIQTKIIHRDARDAKSDLDRFRQELGTDYIDSVLIHVVTEPDWNVRYRGVMDVLSEAKARGTIGAHGVTCHSLAALETAAAEPWVEIDQARFNHRGSHMDAAPEVVQPVLARMRNSGKGVLAMKVLGQGDLATEKEVTLRYCIESGVFHGLVIGFEAPEEIDEVVEVLRGVGAGARRRAA